MPFIQVQTAATSFHGETSQGKERVCVLFQLLPVILVEVGCVVITKTASSCITIVQVQSSGSKGCAWRYAAGYDQGVVFYDSLNTTMQGVSWPGRSTASHVLYCKLQMYIGRGRPACGSLTVQYFQLAS